MEFISKAVFDSVAGSPFAVQDLSRVITLQDGEPRPITSMADQVPAINEIHQWREQGLYAAGTGQESYLEGALPNTAIKAAVSSQNTTCRTGVTAQVTDEMMAVWRGGGRWMLDDAETTRLLQEALDFEVALATELVLNGMEYMHAAGDATNPQGVGVFPGGQTDGLLQWLIAAGSVTYAGGASSTPTAALTEQMIKNAARSIARRYPRIQPDTMLVSASIREDINSYVGSGAARPITQVVRQGADGTAELVGGSNVSFYNTGYSIVKIETEPYYSIIRNANIPGGADAIVLYNKKMVKHAQLLPLRTTALAKTDTSIKQMVTCTYAQEHRNALHAQALLGVQSAFAG